MNPGSLSMDIRTYTHSLLVTIDGTLQTEEQRVDLRWGPAGPRLYCRWAVPDTGLEFDGRPHVGTDRTFRVTVMGPRGEMILTGYEMSLQHFAVGQTGPTNLPCARAVFVPARALREPETLRPPPESPDPFGYSRQVRPRQFFGTQTRDPFGYGREPT